MKTSASFQPFASLSLLALGLIATVAIGFYFLAEVLQAEHILYFAPMPGLLFYSAHYLVDRQAGHRFFHGAYPEDTGEI